MPNPAYDALSYTRDLEDSGLPSKQAEVMARGVERMLAERIDTLVTNEQLQAAMARMDHRFEQLIERMDHRFDAMEQRFDQRFKEVDQRFREVDQRFQQVDQRFQQIDQRLDHADKRTERIEDRLLVVEKLGNQVTLHTWMLGLIIIVVVVPTLQRWFAPL